MLSTATETHQLWTRRKSFVQQLAKHPPVRRVAIASTAANPATG
jgi:hypothetical protein